MAKKRWRGLLNVVKIKWKCNKRHQLIHLLQHNTSFDANDWLPFVIVEYPEMHFDYKSVPHNIRHSKCRIIIAFIDEAVPDRCFLYIGWEGCHVHEDTSRCHGQPSFGFTNEKLFGRNYWGRWTFLIFLYSPIEKNPRIIQYFPILDMCYVQVKGRRNEKT